MPNTTYLTLPYPSLSNAPNVPQDIQNLASGLDGKLGGVIICTSTTRPPARDGALIYETDTRLYKSYNSSVPAWYTIGTNATDLIFKTTSPGSNASGFTAASAIVRTGLNGKLVYFKLDTVNTSTLTASGGGVADTTVYNLNTAYRPTEITNTIFSANNGTGEVQLNPTGEVVLRTLDVNITGGANIRMVFNYIRD
ncbi:MAG: hypothetical protein ABW022_25170 [Actinoplanes sp.]